SRFGPASAVHLSGCRPPVIAREPCTTGHCCLRGPSLARLAFSRTTERAGCGRPACSLAAGGQLSPCIQGRMEKPAELSATPPTSRSEREPCGIPSGSGGPRPESCPSKELPGEAGERESVLRRGDSA